MEIQKNNIQQATMTLNRPEPIIIKIFKLLLVIGLIGGVVFLFLKNKENITRIISLRQQNNIAIPQPVITLIPTLGQTIIAATKEYIKLTVKDAKYSVNDEIHLLLPVEANKKNIVAFDVLVGYDKSALDYIGTNSLKPEYMIFPSTEDGYVSITTAKQLKDKDKIVLFNGDPVLELVFKAKKAGNYNFSLLNAMGKEKTKLVDDQTQIIYPNLNSVNVEIK